MKHYTYEEKLEIGRLLRDPGNLYYKMPDGYRECTSRCTVEPLTIPGEDASVPCLLIKPAGGAANDVLYINIHGGGFVQIHHDWDTEMCAYYAAELGITIVDVDYRLAPEYPFPAGMNDCYAVFRWCFANAAELGIDPKKIIVGGNSAGACLSLNVCQLAGERGEEMPDYLLMVYPAADMGHGFIATPADGVAGLDLKDLETRGGLYNRLYTDDKPEVQEGPYCDFLNAPDAMFEKIPDAVIVTAGKDPLHFSGEKLPTKMLRSGKNINMRCFNESNHGFYVRCLGNEWKAARDYVLDLIAARYGLTRTDSQA